MRSIVNRPVSPAWAICSAMLGTEFASSLRLFARSCEAAQPGIAILMLVPGAWLTSTNDASSEDRSGAPLGFVGNPVLHHVCRRFGQTSAR
jgi:hypothetical protein